MTNFRLLLKNVSPAATKSQKSSPHRIFSFPYVIQSMLCASSLSSHKGPHWLSRQSTTLDQVTSFAAACAAYLHPQCPACTTATCPTKSVSHFNLSRCKRVFALNDCSKISSSAFRFVYARQRANKQAKLPIRLLCIAASAIASLKRRQQTKNNNNPAAHSRFVSHSLCLYWCLFAAGSYIHSQSQNPNSNIISIVCMRSVITAQKRIALSVPQYLTDFIEPLYSLEIRFCLFWFQLIPAPAVVAPLGNDMLFSDVKFILADNNERPNHVRNNNFFLCSRSLRLFLCAIVHVVCVRKGRSRRSFSLVAYLTCAGGCTRVLVMKIHCHECCMNPIPISPGNIFTAVVRCSFCRKKSARVWIINHSLYSNQWSCSTIIIIESMEFHEEKSI